MIDFDINEIRKYTKLFAPGADFDKAYTFYYDETNNIRKFYVRETDFNYSFTANFILGGVVHEGEKPNIQPLFDGLNLQKTVKEAKLKHIAKGDFLQCLRSDKLNFYLQYLLNSNLYIHYSSLNILYWSIVDIVDSAIVHSEPAKKLGPQFANHLKNDLYRLARLEIDGVIELFYKFEYPNIKKESVLSFIEALSSLFQGYIDTLEFHFGLESLRQILKEARKEEALPFIMDEEDHILLKDFSQFYLRPIYTFKNSDHVFDNELSIAEIFKEYRILDNEEEIKNYSFIDSQANLLVQVSDIFVGLMGKLTNYINTSSRDKLETDLSSLREKQLKNLDLLLDLIDKSNNENIGFLHSTDSYEELSKLNVIRQIRNKQ